MQMPPPVWTTEQLTIEAERSRGLFRQERMREPLERWQQVFDIHQEQFERLFNTYGTVNWASLTPVQIAELFRENLGDALRYLAGPPISEDDLKVLAEASLAPKRLASDPDAASRILDVIATAVDPKRFPWISAGRSPTEAEKHAAILASAALITAQRVSTDRRTDGKDAQENAVKDFLLSVGFAEAPTRIISTLADAPHPGHFCAETLVGTRKADIPVRLFDGRLMPLECKVSNSSTNSVKRLNNDAAVKARTWKNEFGIRQVVPAAVLSGVFKIRNLEQAQDSGLTLFWAHKLDDMQGFIDLTR